MKATAAALAFVVLGALSACGAGDGPVVEISGGDAERGRLAVVRYGCPACHTIPRVQGANGLVGPPLGGIANRVYIAGVLTNTPENLMRWLRSPPAVDPLTAMPDMGIGDPDARDIASFLYTLR